MTPPQDEPVGSVGDEAAKLFGALADWANDWANDWAGDHRGDRARQVDEHIATGEPECLYCPICRTVHPLREAGPDVRAQLASAASSFLQAAAGLLAAAGTAEQKPSRVQRIDLDETDEEERP